MAFIAKDKIVRTGDDINLSTVVGLQADATVLGTVADAVGTVAFDRLEKIKKVTLTAATGTTAGAVLSLANPEAAPIVITRIVVNVTGAASTAGRTISVGVAADGTTSGNNLLDALAVDATGVFDNIHDGSTAGKAGATMSATEFLTGTASGALTGFAGVAYIHYVLA